jgi:uncharacterized damage-inducible protein DinB
LARPIIVTQARAGRKEPQVESCEVLLDGFTRVREVVLEVLDGLSANELAFRQGSEANSIAWLVWHLTRIQDDHVADVAGTQQAWTAEGWADRFGLPFPVAETGYGHTSAEVAAVRVSADLLVGYHEAVFGHTVKYVQGLAAADLDRVVDEHWDPPVTLGVRLVSVVSDDLQHGGQAAYVRGMLPAR